MPSQNVVVHLENRDRLELHWEVQGADSVVTSLRASGCLELLKKIKSLKGLLPAPAKKLFVFSEQDHASLMIKEALLKSMGQWKYPYAEAELCHCRAIPTAKVDAAIVSGFHTVEEIAEQTSAGTACGSCRPDSQRCIEYRLIDPAKALRE